eukprot:CAMPEP_0172640578 /NCGR_PEP_ID=MMETSP1068-20121228/223655_1 /TAXON_ID=35684 /ORGANISM="Pseudopedinella elastica, Strain CCMP716" /LENGTH=199 /DNA_ID=CAMNT_0013453987 /DNA_START=247 /DNA_END=843 /DNA_ORIENTATION=+
MSKDGESGGVPVSGDLMATNGRGEAAAPEPLSGATNGGEDAPAPVAIKPYLRGALSFDPTVQTFVIKGRWGFSKADYDSGDPLRVSPFEFKYTSSSSSGGGGGGEESSCPPSTGELKGHIAVRQEGKASQLRVAEHGLHLAFTPLEADGGRFEAKGSGYNKFGKFLLEGAAWRAAAGDNPSDSPEAAAAAGFEVELHKS